MRNSALKEFSMDHSIADARSRSLPPDGHGRGIAALQLDHNDRVLVFAPHPDDESLAAAGVIQRANYVGAALSVVFATDGDNNPWPQRVAERRWHIDHGGRQRWGAKRRSEALDALAALSVKPDCARFLGYPDQGLTAELTQGSKLRTDVLAEIEAFRPSVIISPSLSDRHPDHNALGLLLHFARNRFDDSGTRWLSYMLHGKTPSPDASSLWSLDLSPAELDRKRDAVLRHRSQMILSRKRFLNMVQPCELFFHDSPAPSHGPPLRPVNGTAPVIAPFLGRLGARLTIFAEPQCEMIRSGNLSLDGLHALDLPDNLSDLWIKVTVPWRFLDSTGWRKLTPTALPVSPLLQDKPAVTHAFDEQMRLR